MEKKEFEKRYSDRERYNYHKEIANAGKMPNGDKLTLMQRVSHANKADAIYKRMNTFMKGVEFVKKDKK